MSYSQQVAPLSCPGGEASKEMNHSNTKLTMALVQSNSDKSFDPPPPPYQSKAEIVGFCNYAPSYLIIVGGLFIVYGIVAK